MMFLLLLLLLSLSSDVHGRYCNEAEISSLRQQLTVLENKATMQLTALEARDAQLASKDEQLATLIAQLNTTVYRLAAKDDQQPQKDVQLGAKDDQHNKTDAQIDAKDDQQTQKDAQLDAKVQLANKTAQLADNTSNHEDTLDLCGSIQYKTDSNPARTVSYGTGSLCDKYLKGWYRFTLHGQSATITTSCVQEGHCGTHAPMWLDLEGGSLPQPGEQKVVKACMSWREGCCQWSSSVTVRNCGAYFIYLLNSTPSGCNLAYCTQN